MRLLIKSHPPAMFRIKDRKELNKNVKKRLKRGSGQSRDKTIFHTGWDLVDKWVW
jgi:hypothetical protein